MALSRWRRSRRRRLLGAGALLATLWSQRPPLWGAWATIASPAARRWTPTWPPAGVRRRCRPPPPPRCCCSWTCSASSAWPPRRCSRRRTCAPSWSSATCSRSRFRSSWRRASPASPARSGGATGPTSAGCSSSPPCSAAASGSTSCPRACAATPSGSSTGSGATAQSSRRLSARPRRCARHPPLPRPPHRRCRHCRRCCWRRRCPRWHRHRHWRCCPPSHQSATLGLLLAPYSRGLIVPLSTLRKPPLPPPHHDSQGYRWHIACGSSLTVEPVRRLPGRTDDRSVRFLIDFLLIFCSIDFLLTLDSLRPTSRFDYKNQHYLLQNQRCCYKLVFGLLNWLWSIFDWLWPILTDFGLFLTDFDLFWLTLIYFHASEQSSRCASAVISHYITLYLKNIAKRGMFPRSKPRNADFIMWFYNVDFKADVPIW